MELIQIINNNITTNSNNEITASVLRNVLKAIAGKFSDDIGILEQLQTNSKVNLVSAINELLSNSNNGDNIVKRYGTQEPTNMSFPNLSVLDFYIQSSNNSLWIYTGSEWVQLTNQQGGTFDLSEHNNDPQAHFNLFNNKVDKEQGKGLSTNDYTTTDKNKVSNAYNNKINAVSSQKTGNNVTITLTKQNNETLQTTFDVGGGGITEAPSDNKLYGRKNGTWTEVEAGISSVNWNDIQGKPSTYPSDTVQWNDIEGVPDSFTPSEHTHTIPQITGLQQALNGKADASHIHTLEPLEITQNTMLTATHNNRILMIKGGNINLTLHETHSAGFTGCGIDVVEGVCRFGLGQGITLTGFSVAELNKDEKGYVYRMKQGENNFRLV